MIKPIYLIIIGTVICLVILYYFYHEISDSKKLLTSTYQKNMLLESKIFELERKSNVFIEKYDNLKNVRGQKNSSKIDSPVLSITYHSDMVKNGNLSVKYDEMGNTEVNELLQKINKNRDPKQLSNIHQPIPTKTSHNLVSKLEQDVGYKIPGTSSLLQNNCAQNIQKNTLHIDYPESINIPQNIKPNNIVVDNEFMMDENDEFNNPSKNLETEGDIFEVDMNNIFKNNKIKLLNNTDKKLSYSDSELMFGNDYQDILNSLPNDISDISANSLSSFDETVIKSISENLKNNIVSDSLSASIDVRKKVEDKITRVKNKSKISSKSRNSVVKK
ncbi:hypothetical protein [Acanthamoeba castellanii mimivirus]|uniref:Uncharacterized protein L487 n=6 Tax=Mimivirus TaxID=315393 RepID=YL487_MIMIV|nr:hypothetical protein MIMI_gp0524 [Acanthamoeba polyphaga mimivirus]Q5UQF9.1 RecName: Full=Uncharacterized protein L487 [Acanthamoeba polyphaga mimivirus]AHA45370.1 hypothetical protein HIRU_S464 [Hirudovirus strain Sangsue]ALR84076.1 hypothetical protein [Niemeyer virus]AMZ02930.1 hypothetical protein [Mimivirus Bombay]BAV61594.1 hypothetical protein [Acanthamoeba castellanii mimivirus]AAV50753.1 unknown [Acanthamoeba polyphaga mimivirus]